MGTSAITSANSTSDNVNIIPSANIISTNVNDSVIIIIANNVGSIITIIINKNSITTWPVGPGGAGPTCSYAAGAGPLHRARRARVLVILIL